QRGACPIEAKVLDEHLVGGGCQRRSLHGERKNQRHRGQDRGRDPPSHPSMHRSPFVPWSSADDTARDADRRGGSQKGPTVPIGRSRYGRCGMPECPTGGCGRRTDTLAGVLDLGAVLVDFDGTACSVDVTELLL